MLKTKIAYSPTVLFENINPIKIIKLGKIQIVTLILILECFPKKKKKNPNPGIALSLYKYNSNLQPVV